MPQLVQQKRQQTHFGRALTERAPHYISAFGKAVDHEKVRLAPHGQTVASVPRACQTHQLPATLPDGSDQWENEFDDPVLHEEAFNRRELVSRPVVTPERNGIMKVFMTLTLPLEPQEEAKLVAAARARGVSLDALVREALGTIFSEAATEAPGKEPTRSLRGLLAKYGPAPSAEEIDQNRAEMFANFPRSDF